MVWFSRCGLLMNVRAGVRPVAELKLVTSRRQNQLVFRNHYNSTLHRITLAIRVSYRMNVRHVKGAESGFSRKKPRKSMTRFPNNPRTVIRERKQQLQQKKILAAAGIAAALAPKVAKGAIADVATEIKASLSSVTVGGQVVVVDRLGGFASQAWGDCRLSHSGAPRAMSAVEKYNIASVSKAVTAAAMIRALYDHPSVTLNSPFAPYLPQHWVVDPSLKNVTFKQLLQHKSGIRNNFQLSYGALKDVVFAGVKSEDINERKYINTNYAMMRLLIPRIANHSIAQIPNNTPSSVVQSLEQVQAYQFALNYIDYVQKTVWDKTGVSANMQCKPISTNPALTYPYPVDDTNGEDYGDRTLTCASGGWNASSLQIAMFMKTLFETSSILTPTWSKAMVDEKMGFDGYGTVEGHTYWYKSGDYPAPPYDGELHAKAFGFSNGVYVGLIINSAIKVSPTLGGRILNGFKAGY